MWLILLIAAYAIPFITQGLESSKECNVLESNVSNCWDPLGKIMDATEVAQGVVCKLQNDIDSFENVMCTSSGWLPIPTNNISEGITLHNRHKRFLFGIFHLIGCIFKRCRPRDHTPPNMRGVCQHDINKTADKFQTNTIVSWPENNAFDDRDGQVRTFLVNGKSPGHHFWGVTTIAYMARDRSGNAATCSFVVNVTVIRCPKIHRIQDGYYICHPSDDMIYGAVCRFGCYAGHELTGGNSEVTCTQSGKWSGTFPRCQKVTCPSLRPTMSKLSYTCTDENKFRSICTYACANGYDIKPGMSRVRVCTQYKFWRGSIPECTDIKPPKFTTCPGIIFGYTGRNSLEGQALWVIPTATDNHDHAINTSWSEPLYPNKVLEPGTYTVTYTAEDSAGNKALPCVTKVVIKAIRCPNIFPTPFQMVTCPSGTNYGSSCNISCEDGTILNGTQEVVCEREDQDTFGHWTWDDIQPYCEVIQKCAKKPNTPKNGALACDTWLGGQFCQMLCRDGYDVSPGRKFEEMLTCGESGDWLPRNSVPIPDCSRSLMARYGIYRMSASYYFEGDCTKTETTIAIKQQFIETLSSSITFEAACSASEEKCKIENVQVICGAATRKRSISMVIKFDMTIPIGNKTIESDYSSLLPNFRMNDVLSSLVNTTGIMQDIHQESFKLDCPPRTIESLHTLSCVECSPGTFYDYKSLTCPPCERGFYQNLPGQISCKQCLGNTTTKSINSKSITDCTDACEPGYWSVDGTPVCSLCPIGSFSNTYGATECKTCQYSQSTEKEGASEISHCQEFDVWMVDEKSLVVLPFEPVHSYSNFIASMWFQIYNGKDALSISLRNRRENSHIKIVINENISLSTERESDVKPFGIDDGWHFLVLSFNDTATNMYVDTVKWSRIKESFRIIGEDNYAVEIEGKGKISQFNIWSSSSISQTDLLAEVMTEKKTCRVQATADILSWKEFENINAEFFFKHMPSECDDFNSCKSNPCSYGVCIDKLDGFECRCQHGFFGQTCEGNVDDCLANACENNSTCQDGASNYTCICTEGFKGDLCEIAMVDGEWGKWNEWTPCSVTCGNGTQRRHRYCNNPAPDNGGLECPGNSSDIQMCSMEECRVCGNLSVTDHVIISCKTDSLNTNCTLTCEDGYEFDHSIKPFYLCGDSTYQYWDFKTADNPDGKLPQCIERNGNEEMSFIYSASYEDLICDSNEKVEVSKINISQQVTMQTKNIHCIENGTCTLQKVDVANCHARQKREIGGTSAGFKLKITCNSLVHSSEECYEILVEALRILLFKTNTNAFSTTVLDQLYHIQASSAHVSTHVKCQHGMVSSNIYCVECTYGRYFKDNECLKCEFGTYQDETGQSSCKECPEGTTTPGRESRSVKECSVHLKGKKNEGIYIAFGVLSAVLCVGLLAVTILLFRKCAQKHTDFMLPDIVSRRHGTGKPVSYELKVQKFYEK